MKGTDGKAIDTAEQRAAREHYATRALRRAKGHSRSDSTLYNEQGQRRPSRETLELRAAFR